MSGITDSMNMNFSMLWEMLKDREALHIAVDVVSKVKHDSATEEIFSKQKGLPPHTIQPTRGGKGGKQIYLIPPEHKHKSHPTETYTKHWINPTHQGKKSKGGRNST